MVTKVACGKNSSGSELRAGARRVNVYACSTTLVYYIALFIFKEHSFILIINCFNFHLQNFECHYTLRKVQKIRVISRGLENTFSLLQWLSIRKKTFVPKYCTIIFYIRVI